MKQIRIFGSVALLLSVLCGCRATAQVDIYPLPQSVEWGEGVVSAKRGYTLIGEDQADTDAVRVVSENLDITSNGLNIIIGERGDKAVAQYEDQIPMRDEGYLLLVEDQRVVIAGNDERGTFYGVQTFLQTIGSKGVAKVKVVDYPSIAERGMIEGYYGNPLSYEDRVSQFEFYGKNKMNVYIYGPKDDPYHGFSTRWRECYPEQQAQRIISLVEEAAKNKVQFVWAVHPGKDIKWGDEDRKATLKKFESMYELGVRSYAVFFDDISGEGTDATQQAAYLNYLQREFVEKMDGVTPLILCPTQYNQAWSGGDYLDILGSELLPEIQIMWTGKSVCHMIDEQTMSWINDRIGRKAYIWLNYPVTDYAISQLLMGPFVGNEQSIAPQISGFVSNPMEYGEASKVALFSIADYAWNMEQFDAEASWLAALRHILPDEAEPFKIFCENSVDIGVSYHRLRMPNESAPFASDTTAFWSGFAPDKYNESASRAIGKHLDEFIVAAQELKGSRHNPRLIEEITPWLDVFDLISRRGKLLLEMQSLLAEGDSVAFIDRYMQVKDLEQQQKAIRSRDFEGSIKVATPKPANEVVAPFFARLQSEMVKFYRSNYQYRVEELPVVALSEGRYYIKVNGRYLSNVDGAAQVMLLSEMDNTNPQRQEWLVDYNAHLERYTIANAFDGSRLNVQCKVDKREYLPLWHALTITLEGEKYAVGVDGISGIYRWVLNNSGELESVKEGSKPQSLIFDFEVISK